MGCSKATLVVASMRNSLRWTHATRSVAHPADDCISIAIEEQVNGALKQYTCDVQVMGKGLARGIVVWLNTASQVDAKKAAQAQFPGATIASVPNVKEKK